MKTVKHRVSPFEKNGSSASTPIVNDASSSSPIDHNSKVVEHHGEALNERTTGTASRDVGLFDDDEAVRMDYDDDEIKTNLTKSANLSVKSASSIIINTDGGSLKHAERNTDPVIHSDTASSSSAESGFGTVDDEMLEQNTTNKSSSKPGQSLTMNVNECQTDKTLGSHCYNNKLLPNSLPILQPPGRQFGSSNGASTCEDAVNILSSQPGNLIGSSNVRYHLHETSSLNSSLSSSDQSLTFGNCCQKAYNKLLALYYGFFCCYLSNYPDPNNPNPHNTPFVCSWLSIFCCCCPLLGAISLYLTHRSRKYKLKQKYDLAEKYSNYAEKLNIAALIFGVIFYAIAFFLVTLVIFMFWRSKSS